MTEKHKTVNSVIKLSKIYKIIYIIIYMQVGKGHLNAKIEEMNKNVNIKMQIIKVLKNFNAQKI